MKIEKLFYGLMNGCSKGSKFFAVLSATGAIAGFLCAGALDICARRAARKEYKEEMDRRNKNED